MSNSKNPNLRVVSGRDLGSALRPAGDDWWKPQGTSSAKPARLSRSKAPFARVPLSWLANHELVPPHLRLLLVLLYRSHEGQKPVRLTSALASEAGIPLRRRHRYARRLEQLGAVHIERTGHRVLTVEVRLATPTKG